MDSITSERATGRARATAAFRLLGYDRRSALVVGMIVAAGAVAAVIWHRYLDFETTDPLLTTCWLLMLALMVSRVDAAHDTRVALVAFAGGAFIEAWGTRSGLWEYFTLAKPPLFILLAWPPATLATERLARLADKASSALVERTMLWWYGWLAIVGGFTVYLTWWARPSYGHPLTWFAGAAVALVLVTCRDYRVDLCRFVGGAALGYLLERWGTTRECWTYWSGGTPPLVAVFAHGFAAIAFLRAVDMWQRRESLRRS